MDLRRDVTRVHYRQLLRRVQLHLHNETKSHSYGYRWHQGPHVISFHTLFHNTLKLMLLAYKTTYSFCVESAASWIPGR